MALVEALPRRLASWITAEPDWDQIFADQLPRVLNFFRYRMPPGADVEDLTSRTFEKAWRARHRYRRDLAGFSTWLLTIARHVAIDALRARQRHEPLEAATSVAAPGRTPEQEAVRDSDGDRLSALLATLDSRQRELIALKYGADMTNRAIAHATGLSESNVGTILHRAVETLRGRW
jgi:RNA polymerase sigma-70 factor (ECF subfamily)